MNENIGEEDMRQGASVNEEWGQKETDLNYRLTINCNKICLFTVKYFGGMFSLCDTLLSQPNSTSTSIQPQLELGVT